jgi:membrane protein DedA with SNARE-associated domain
MRRTITADHVHFHLWPYRTLTPAQLDALHHAAERYGRFLHLSARLTLP